MRTIFSDPLWHSTSTTQTPRATKTRAFLHTYMQIIESWQTDCRNRARRESIFWCHIGQPRFCMQQRTWCPTCTGPPANELNYRAICCLQCLFDCMGSSKAGSDQVHPNMESTPTHATMCPRFRIILDRQICKNHLCVIRIHSCTRTV